MITQSYQETQRYQTHNGYPMNHNYGLSVENSQLSGSQVPSSNLNQHANFGSSQHHHSLQHGICPPQTSYHGNGCYGTSLSNPKRMHPLLHSALAPTSCTCNSFSGCSMPLGSYQDSQLQLQQGTMVQPGHKPSSGTEHWHPRNRPLTYSGQSISRLQSESTHGIQNHSQSNVNGTVIPNRGQMLSSQLQATDPNINRSSIPAQPQTLQLEHSRCQGLFNTLLQFPASRKCCFKYHLIPIWQALSERMNMRPDNLNVNKSSHPTRICQLQSCEQGHVQMPFVYQCCPSCLNKILQFYLFKLSQQQQHIQMNGELSTNGHALQPTQNGWIPSGTNGQNVMQATSPSSSRPQSNCHIVHNVNHRQSSRRNMTVSSSISSSTVASPPIYSTNSTSSLPVSSGLSALPPCHLYGTYSQSDISKNMSNLGYPRYVHTNQNNPTSVDNSNRNDGRVPNLSNGSRDYGASVQQQNTPIDSALHRKSTELYNNLDPNRPATTSIDKNRLPEHNRLEDNTESSNTNSTHCYIVPNIHMAWTQVAVVTPLKPPADGGKLKTCEDVTPLKCGDDLPLLIKELQPLAVEDITEEAIMALDTDCSAMRETLTSVKSSEDGSYPSLGSLINLSPESEDTHKNQNNEELSQPDVFFDVPVVALRLGMLRKLVASLELKEEETKKDESSMNKNELDFAHAILDLYWDGSYHNYIETELAGTFANILKEAAEFDTEEDKTIFDSINVKDLNQLQQSKGHILTNCFDFDYAMDVDTSSWRNLGDESLDIDKELADGSFLENSHEKSLERSLLSNLQNLGKNLDQNLISSKKHDPSPIIIIDDQSDESDEDCSKTPDDPLLPIKTILLSLDELKALPTQACKDSDRAHGVAAPSTCVNVNYSEVKLVAEDSVISHHSCQDVDQKEVSPEDGCKLSENLSKEVETSNMDCLSRLDDYILSMKLPSVNELKKVDSENVYQDLVSSPQKDPPSPILLDEHSECPKSPDDPILSMKITVLSMDELKALSGEFCKDSDDGVHIVALSSAICLDSEDDDDSEVNLGQTCQTIRDLSQTSNQELITILDGEEEIPSVASIKDVFKPKQDKTNSTEVKQDGHLTKTTGKEPINPLIDRRKGNEAQEPQQHMQKEHSHPKLNRWSSIYQKVSRKDSVQTAHQPEKPHGLETHVANSSSCGIRVSHPISPSAAIRKRKFSVMEDSSSPDTVKGLEPKRQSHASHGHESSSIPTSILQSLPLKKRKQSFAELGNSVKLTDITVPSSHSPLNETMTLSNPQDTGVDTELADDKIHMDEVVGLPTTSEDTALNLAGTSDISELQKSSRVCKKRKHVTLRLYGAQWSDHKDLNGTAHYYTDCVRDMPIHLSIIQSLEKSSAKDKIRKSWEDRFVPPPGKSKDKIRKSWEDRFVPTPGKSKRLSRPEGVRRKKNVHVRPVKHRKSQGPPGKDKEEQQRPPAKKHQSKHVSASLGS
ncbi:uncharacterized protein si:ch211-106e7.2 [Sardina pilchardus]|uniref:uncharacterized protein si:ch211-106e7.2 n=1 Tax=Sardina pilchardus TaxID=27697 RepID=UPI002E1435FD